MATDHNFKVKNGLEVLGGNLSLSGDSRKIEMLDGTTNSQPSIAIGEQSNWGVRQRWDSGQKVIFEGWWNSATSGSVNRDFGYLDAYNTKWRFNDYVGINVDANTNYRLYVNGNIRADGAYYVGGQTVIDSSRNLTNIGTISSGAIDAGGRIKATNWIELESAGAAITSEEAGIRIDYNDTAAWYLYKDNANGAALHIQSAAVDSDGSPRVRFNRTVRETYIGGALAVNQYSISSGYALDVSGTARSGAHTIYTQASTLEGINLVANVSSANQNSDSPKIQFNGEYQSNGPYIQGDNVGSYGYKSLKFYTNRNSGTDYTTAPTVTLTLDSTGNAQFAGTLTSGAITSTGAVQGAVLRAASTGPTITLNDTDAANATNQVGYISFQRQGSEKAWLGYGSNGNADFSIRNTEGPITLLSNLESAYTIESGAITTTGNIQQNYGYELRGKDSGGSARTLLRTNSNKLQIGWSYAGDVEFMGGGSYTKRMAISGTTGDISIANDLDVAGDMQFTSQNHEWSAGASGSGNNILGKVGNAGAAGIVLKDVNNVFRVQLYGDGTNYGFLNAEWASWDFKKEIGGSLYLNNNTNYNLRPDGTTNLNNLNVVGNLTVSGTTTTLNTANLAVEDNNITLNYSTGDSSASANGAGITIQDAVDASTDATILWDAGNDEFDFSHTITLPQDKFIHFGTSAWKIGANGNDLNIFSSDDVNVYAGWQRFFYSNVEYARIGSSGGNWVTGNTEIKTGSVTLGTGYNLQWGGAYGSGKPTISATGNALFFYPTGNVSGANFRLYADMAEIRDGNALRFQRAGNSAYGELTYDSGENITLYSSWGGKYLRLTRDGNLQLSGTTRISHAGDITSSTGLLSNSRQNYASGTAGWLLELDIATNNYAHIHGTIKLQQFNFNTQQIVNFSATVLNNGTVNTKAATSDIDITLKLFVYNSKWYVHVPAPSTYTDISAYVHMGAGYQGPSYSESCLLSISNAAVPSSGVSGSVDIVAKKRAFEDDDVTFGAITANNTGNAVIAQYNSTNYTALRYDGVDTVLGGDGVYRRGGTEKLRLTTSGVSVTGTLGTGAITSTGNMSLTGELDITKSGSTHSLILGNRDDFADSSSDSLIWITSGGGTFKYGEGAHLVFEGRKQTRNFYFKVGNVTAPQHIMHHNGYVGFGTGDITPTDRVHVDGTVRASSYKIGTSTVIDSSKNLTNINSMHVTGTSGIGVGTAASSFGTGVSTVLLQGTSSTNGRAGALWFREYDGSTTSALYSTDGADGYGTVLAAYQGDLKLATGSLTGTALTIDTSQDATFTGSVTTTDGTLHLAGGNYEGLIKFGTNASWHSGIRQHDDADAELRIWHKNTNGMIFLATGYDGEPASISRPTDGLAIQQNKLGIGNFSSVDPQAKLHVKHTADFQLLLDGDTTSWAGIRFKDTNGQDDIWYAGDGDTFSIGGGGSTGITNKKLHVHGATTIGSGMKQLSMPTDGLRVQGNIEANSNLILGNGSSSGVLKLYTYDDAANHWDVYTWTDDTFRLNYNGAGSDEFILDSSGNVQITGDIWINKGSQGGLIQFGQSTSGDYLKLQDISSGSNVLELYQDADLKFGIDGVTGDTYVKGCLRTYDEGIFGKLNNKWHTANALRGGNFSADIGNDTTVLKLFPASTQDESSNVRAANDYNTGIAFMHLDPDSSGWGNAYQGAQAWIGMRLHDTSGQERDFLTFATNNSSTAGTMPVERMAISPEGHVGINVTDPNHGLAVSGGGTMTAGWNKSLMMKANFPVLTWNSVAGSGGYSGIGYDASTSEHSWNFWHRGTSEDVAGTARLPFAIKTSEVVINESSHNTDFRVETDANENMLLVDASGGTVQVGHGNTGWAELDVQGDISIRGPSNFGTLEFRRGANSLVFARIGFDNPSLANDTFVIDSSGNGNPLGFLTNSDPIYFWVGNNTGATADVRIENAGGMVINENGNDSDFRVESNNQDHMLFVDAGNDLVGIGRSDPAHALDVYKASPAGGVVARFQSAADSWIQLKGTTGRSYQIGATGSALRFYDDTTQRYMFDISSSASGPVNAHGYREGALTVVANTNYSGWVRVARSALATNGYGARGAFRVTVAGTGGYLGPGEVSVSGFKNWSDLAAITRTEYASSQYFESARVTMDANYAYLELSLRGTLNVGGNSQFYVRVWNTGLYGDRWTPYTENLTAGLSSPTYTSVTRTWNNVASGAVAVANIRMTSGADVYASGSGWDDCLNLWSSDATKYWNLLVDNGVGDSLRFATNQSGSLVEVARFDYDQINLYKTIYAQFAEFNTGSDIQVRLRSPDNWAGIQFQDSNGTEQIYYNGQHSTFAIGGGGSNVSGKKLHVDGGMTVGASLDSTSNYTDGITVAGGIDSQNAIKINYEGNGNNGTDACIAVYHTSADWGLKIEKLITGTYYDYGIINNGSGTYAYHQKNQGTETIRFNYNGNALFAGNVTAYASLSDVRLKEDIDTIPDALDKVCRLDGVTFNYKKDGVRSTGLLAQQLLEVLPEAVYKTEELDGDIEDQYYAINYGNTVGLLVEAIKDLKQENDELKTMIAQIAKKLGD